MAKKKVMVWVEDEHFECMIKDEADLFDNILWALRYARHGIGEIVPEDDKTWGGYRRITVHVSPPMCQIGECSQPLHEGEETVCDWHKEKEE